jgi:hypothetical protein
MITDGADTGHRDADTGHRDTETKLIPINPRYFLGALAATALIAYPVHLLTHVNYWIMWGIIVAAVFVNGLIASSGVDD